MQQQYQSLTRSDAIATVAWGLEHLSLPTLRQLAFIVDGQARRRREALKERNADRARRRGGLMEWCPDIHATPIPEAAVTCCWNQPRCLPFTLTHNCPGLAAAGEKVLARPVSLTHHARYKGDGLRRVEQILGKWIILVARTTLEHVVRPALGFFPLLVQQWGYQYASFQAWAGAPAELRSFRRVEMPGRTVFEPITTTQEEFEDAMTRCGIGAEGGVQ